MERLKNYDGEIRSGFLSAPRIIDSPYPFLAITDLNEMVGRLIPSSPKSLSVIDHFQSELLLIQKNYAPELSSFYTIDQKDLITKTEGLIEKKYLDEVGDQKKVGIINFDRYILKDSFCGDIFRLNLSRGPNGDLVARPGSGISKNDQINAMNEWLFSGNYNSLIFVDDVIAFADTFRSLTGLIKKLIPDIKISAIGGVCSTGGIWSGKEKLNVLGVDVVSEILVSASSSIDGGSTGMAIPDSRDFTVFGGKIGVFNDRCISFPYFYPFSKPLNSFYKNGSEYDASAEIFDLNQRFVLAIEKIKGSKLLIGDLEKAGFGIPYTSIDELVGRMPVPKFNDSIYGFLDEVGHLFF